jgi:hypothetical protein
MGIVMPETRWAVSVRQSNKNFTIDCCIWLGVLFEWSNMHGTTNPKFSNVLHYLTTFRCVQNGWSHRFMSGYIALCLHFRIRSNMGSSGALSPIADNEFRKYVHVFWWLCCVHLERRVRLHSRLCMDWSKRLCMVLKRCTQDHTAIRNASLPLADVAESIHYF